MATQAVSSTRQAEPLQSAPPSISTEAALLPFPSTWKASLSHWWSSSSASGVYAQNALVRRGFANTDVVFQEDRNDPIVSEKSHKAVGVAPAQQKIARVRKIPLDDSKDRWLNVLEVGTPQRAPDEHTFVILHGYGGAFAFYWQNMAAMSAFPNTRLYFMDMLGMGLSGRPKFPNIKVKNPQSQEGMRARAAQAEEFFVDSFEDFAKHEKLNKFTLIGHSLGGYLSTSYALRKPERIDKLILISPVGVPQSPYHSDKEAEAAEAKKAERGEGVQAEFSESQLSTTRTASKSTVKPKQPSGWWTYLWEANISPFSLVRFSSMLGPKLVSRYASHRFALFEAPVQADLFSYLYSVYGQKGSGEYCLAHILMPGAYARWPLISRIVGLDRRIPVSFIYGDKDWMDERAGRDALSLLRKQTTQSDLQHKSSQFYINKWAGHWTFLDNPEGMNKILQKEMQIAIDDAKQA